MPGEYEPPWCAPACRRFGQSGAEAPHSREAPDLVGIQNLLCNYYNLFYGLSGHNHSNKLSVEVV